RFRARRGTGSISATRLARSRARRRSAIARARSILAIAMPVIRLETWIDAAIETCFDLARSVDAHVSSTTRSRERAVAGGTRGLLDLGDEVTWEARHLGIRQRLTARVTRFERPRVFEDRMVRGAFRSFVHLHEFEPQRGGTLMVDTFDY